MSKSYSLRLSSKIIFFIKLHSPTIGIFSSSSLELVVFLPVFSAHCILYYLFSPLYTHEVSHIYLYTVGAHKLLNEDMNGYQEGCLAFPLPSLGHF